MRAAVGGRRCAVSAASPTAGIRVDVRLGLGARVHAGARSPAGDRTAPPAGRRQARSPDHQSFRMSNRSISGHNSVVGRGTCQLVRLPRALAVLALGCCGRGGLCAPARSSDLLRAS